MAGHTPTDGEWTFRELAGDDSRGMGDNKDTCQLCGLDLRDDLHVRGKVAK